ncbi:MAG: hypothetical protein H6581_11805 [Bacteroidia bacterium]|nr:hypothetical protein [Bacteroidia bacterium]
MKKFLSLLLLILPLTSFTQTENPNLDTALVRKLGADDYGMKSYMFVVLKSGENTTEPKESQQKLFMGHLANINRLAKEGKLVVAGPFGKNENDFRGLFILNVTTLEEAEALLETDPAIKADLLRAEIYPWYGSAALPQYLDDADKIWKVKP